MLMMTPPLLRYFWFHSIHSHAASCSLQSVACARLSERGRWQLFSHFLLLNNFPPPSRSLEQASSLRSAVCGLRSAVCKCHTPPKWPDRSQLDHLQSWSRIFRSDQTEKVRSIWCTNRNYRNFGLNGKRPPKMCHRTSTTNNPKVWNGEFTTS